MNFDLSEEQTMLSQQASRILADQASPARLRAFLDNPDPFDSGLWRQLCELSYPAVIVPERFGGLGMSAFDFGLICEELGRTCAPAPLSSSTMLCAEAIAVAGSDEQRGRLLPELAEGRCIGTLAHLEVPGSTFETAIDAKFVGGRLTGVKFPVPDALAAAGAVVVARTGDGALALAYAHLDQPGVSRQFVRGIDELRPHYRVHFDNVRAELLTEGREAIGALRILYDRAAVFTSFEQVGGAEACLHMARDYALQRKVFGRAIGSYQAIKHRIADMLCLVELARSNAWFAAWALDNDPTAVPAAAATARISATEAYEMASRENLQVHGGIGYTWDANCHFHYRRSRLLAASLGGLADWSDRLVTVLGSEAPAAIPGEG
jgi:acyl-CoA dehydrogenase